MNQTDSEGSSKQVIARAAHILRALEGNASGMILADLVRSTDLPRTTVQRIVQALQAQQLVTFANGLVSLGPAITRLAGSTFLDVVAPIGSALPLHCTAHGKALLATMTDDEIVQRMAGPWEMKTPRTVASLDRLLAQIDEIRREPIGYDIGENLEGVCGLGIVLETRTTERYALSIATPAVRYMSQRQNTIRLLRTCGENIAVSFLER